MTDHVEVTILGCGSSGGVPRIGNDWGDCDPANPRNRRRRCSLLVERISDTGRTSVVIDTGPDLREQLLESETEHLDAVLYTHAHADHLHGIDDLRMLAIRHHKKVHVYMDSPTFERARSAFGYCFWTPEGSSYPPILERHSLKSGNKTIICGSGGDLTFLPVEVQHGEITALGFVFHGIAYIPDVSDISDLAVEAFFGVDVMILDCLRHAPHPSHFNLDDAIVWRKKLAPKHCIMTNMHCDLDYKTMKQSLPEKTEPAYDGLKIKVEASSPS